MTPPHHGIFSIQDDKSVGCVYESFLLGVLVDEERSVGV